MKPLDYTQQHNNNNNEYKYWHDTQKHGSIIIIFKFNQIAAYRKIESGNDNNNNSFNISSLYYNVLNII